MNGVGVWVNSRLKTPFRPIVMVFTISLLASACSTKNKYEVHAGLMGGNYVETYKTTLADAIAAESGQAITGGTNTSLTAGTGGLLIGIRETTPIKLTTTLDLTLAYGSLPSVFIDGVFTSASFLSVGFTGKFEYPVFSKLYLGLGYSYQSITTQFSGRALFSTEDVKATYKSTAFTLGPSMRSFFYLSDQWKLNYGVFYHQAIKTHSQIKSANFLDVFISVGKDIK